MKLNFEKILLKTPEESKHLVTFSKIGKNYQMHLKKSFLEQEELNECIVEFLVVQSKKILGFRKITTIKQQEMKKETMRFLHCNATGQVQLGIDRILKSLGISLTEKTEKFLIKNYVDEFYGDIYYIDFKKVEPKEEK